MADPRKRDQSRMAAAFGPLKVALAKTSRLLVPVWKWMAKPAVLFTAILILGTAVRVWRFGQTPPGLNQDEASIGVDAYDLYRFGVDRNGVSYPVNLISWGSGQNALYAYLLIPFIAIGGLTPFTVRLPMLISGILALPLVYFIAKRTMGKEYALISMLLVAICPWHILLSRWGLESNILPFVFLLGYLSLLKSAPDNRWFIWACFFFALCFYAYGTAYAAVPIFILGAVPVLLFTKRVRTGTLIAGIVVFVALSIPIGLFLVVNSLHLDSIHIGIVTIPRYPSQPRYEALGALFQSGTLDNLVINLRRLAKLLLRQNDGLLFNSVPPYGYFYRYTFPVATIGGAFILFARKLFSSAERLFLVCWLAAASVAGLLLLANFNRINLIFIPLLLCMAVPMLWLWERWKIIFTSVILVLLAAFITFTHTYFGDDYRQQISGNFFPGLLPALDYARQVGNEPICVTGNINMPYIFVLFSEKLDPASYLDSVKYVDPRASMRQVVALGRYSFGLENCPGNPGAVYVLNSWEEPPASGIQYSQTDFDLYRVFVPR